MRRSEPAYKAPRLGYKTAKIPQTVDQDAEAGYNQVTSPHRQHRGLVEALENREGARAEALAREHSRAAAAYLRDVLAGRDQNPAGASPSLRLIRKGSAP
jgi:hypothetical protein